MARLPGAPQGVPRLIESMSSGPADDPPATAIVQDDPRRWILVLGALGVVYGDIGTSPLYAFRECFAGGRLVPSEANVLGVLSLIVWSLILVVSIKYLLFIMRADNRGEGGILALLTLVAPKLTPGSTSRAALVTMGLFGAALLYGDGMITPAISVLSAVEGLEVATPALSHTVVPVSVAILVVLFLLQRKGTSAVGALFGPLTLAWFIVIAGLGALSVAQTPRVLLAVNPLYAVDFFRINQLTGFLVLGAVFLVVTGGEALYADMGHFGLAPIRTAWFRIVFPALALNYFGQGGLLLREPASIHNPFYLLAPAWGLLPLTILATAATIVASQAVISGAFSLTRQALQLGYLPRMEIRHSSAHQIGQVYVPFINWLLLVCTVGLVIGFRSSANLAGAYGVAVTTTMVITTLLAFVFTRRVWHWSLPRALAVACLLLVVDLSFFGANLVKIPAGGWFPLLVAAILFTVMTTWKEGRSLLARRLESLRITEQQLLSSLAHERVPRVRGTAIFMDSSPVGIPRTLLHNVKHNRVLHDQNLILTVVTDEVPRVSPAGRLDLTEMAPQFYRVVAHYGYMETPRIDEILRELQRDERITLEPLPSVFLGRETLIVTPQPGMARWRKQLFTLMSRNARRATLHFGIEPGWVLEIGRQVEL